MTAQIHDSILLQNKKFSIVGINGNELFNPFHFNLRPLPRITSCWRGYICEYKIVHNKLLLHTLKVNLQEQGPALNNVEPALSTQDLFNNIYDGLDLPLDFTGKIQAADGFIRELYVHMGFHPAWKYETVYELTVSSGYVLDTKDISEEMRQLRERMIKANKQHQEI